MREYLNFIGGEWVAARASKTFQNVNPADTREVVTQYPASGKEEAQEAIQAAQKAHPAWAALTPVARGRILSKTSQLLEARKADCKALAVFMSAGEAIKMTSLGRFQMGGPQSGFMTLLKKLKGSRAESGSSGERQMKMLRRLPKILRFIPGTAQDARAYFVTMQYWLAGSEENIANMVRYLASRFVPGLGDTSKLSAPRNYPDVGLYHPSLSNRMCESDVILTFLVIIHARWALLYIHLLSFGEVNEENLCRSPLYWRA